MVRGRAQRNPHRWVLHRGDARVRHPEELQGRHRDGQPPAQAQGHRRHDLVLGPHTDFTQTKGFIEGVNPRHIYLVHGEKTNVTKLHDELLKLYKPRNITVHFLVNSRTYTNDINTNSDVKLVGSLAAAALSLPQAAPSFTLSPAAAAAALAAPETRGQKRMFSGDLCE